MTAGHSIEVTEGWDQARVSFTATPETGKQSLFVQFTGGAAIPVVSTRKNPTVWFNDATSYHVTLTTRHADGTISSKTMTNAIRVTT